MKKKRFYDNTGTVPEMWAQEALLILNNYLTLANRVHRDYEPMVASYGDTVNANRPAKRTGKRKVDGDTITDSTTSTTKVPVVLDQHAYDSFIIYDREASLSFMSLVDLHLRPSVQAVAQLVDRAIANQVYHFRGNSVGRLGQSVTKTNLALADAKAITLGWPEGDPRTLLVTPNSKAAIMDIDKLVTAEKVGDDGTRLRQASLGRIFNLDGIVSQNAPSIAFGVSTTVTGAINNGAGYAKGTTALTVDNLSAAITNGAWCNIEGDDTPQMITGTTGGATPTALAIYPGLVRPVADDAVVTIYTPGAVNFASGYDAGYAKDLVINGFTVAPQVGQMISLGNTSAAKIYGALETPTTTAMLLDRPLAAAAAHTSVVGVGPAGDYNWGFHKNAVALVNRPLALPLAGSGAMGAVASFGGLSIRVVMQYDSAKQGTRVTVDLLCGVTVLDANLGFVLYA